MSDDRDAPTPRQTGSFAIMLNICRDSQLELERWLEHAPEPVVERVIFIIRRFKRCSTEVQGWKPDTPQESKRRTIDDILALRAEAQDLAKKYGHTLQ